MTKRNKKVVLFLGAGFSRAFGLPTMREFFATANDSPRISEDDKAFVRELRKSAREGASMVLGEHENLEHVLSLAMMDSRSRKNSTTDKRPADRLKEILLRVYSNVNVEAVQTLPKKLAELLNRDAFGEQTLTVVTTNYDVLAEFGLAQIDLAPRLPFKWVDPRAGKGYGSMYSTRSHAPLLCKLHGSLNLCLNADNALSVEASIAMVHADFRGRESTVLPLICANNYLKDYGLASTPLIVPPTLYKQPSVSEFEAIWDTASEAMATADRLVVIGYSFPPSDTYMKYFFGSALVKNVDLPRIDIVDPNATGIVNRLKESDFGHHFKQLLYPVDGEWQKIRYVVPG
jgi:NAD-dependent SIR2 family protein deacetylase